MGTTDDTDRMITVRWKLSIGFPGAIQEGEFEIEADASSEEIEEAIREDAMQHVEYWRVDENGKAGA